MTTTDPKAGPMTREEVVAALEHLAARWPSDLMLFSWNGTLCLVDRAAWMAAMDKRDGLACAASVARLDSAQQHARDCGATDDEIREAAAGQ